jgi:hypothetical protein
VTYLHVTLELQPGALGRFRAVMARTTPVLEAAGWRLAGAYLQRTGRLNTVIDLWALEDMSHYDRGIAALVARPDFADIKAELDASVTKETVVFADALSY